MLPLLKINLLPYREALIAKQKKQFQTLMIGAALVGVGLSVLVYLGMQSWAISQENRNQTLKDGIAKSDIKINKIKELNDERKNFLARKHKVEELSEKRFEAARILDSLNTLVPDGLYLTSIEAQTKPNTYIINGQAISDGKTAVFMNALPGKIFTTPELLNIKRGTDAQQFSLSVGIKSETDNDANDSSNDEPASNNSATEDQNTNQASDSASAPNN